jgi:hypothetical protein
VKACSVVFYYVVMTCLQIYNVMMTMSMGELTEGVGAVVISAITFESLSNSYNASARDVFFIPES